MTATLMTGIDEHHFQRRHWCPSPEILVALGGFILFAVLILTRATALLEPDDYAYRASIVALDHGHILLTNAQYRTLNQQLAQSGGQGILQWHHLASGKWISEKNPGYPFFAVFFYFIGLLRVTPIFFGALASVGLFAGAKAWLGKWAGTYAVWLFLFSGAAMTFAWRDTMPSFTDASLIAAGFGALLWAMLSKESKARRRLVAGLGGFLALESAVFIRYTNIIELLLAIVAALCFAKASSIPWRTRWVWMGSVVVFGAAVLGFDQWAYGSATSTGYSPGEITFSLSALWPNLKGMPRPLTTSMPFWILAGLACVFIAVRVTRACGGANSDSSGRLVARRDSAVGLVLALGWLGLWFLYLTYTWTVHQAGGGPGPGGGGSTVHVIRFYLPALGLIALLGAWLLVRLGRFIPWVLLAGILLASILSFNSMTNAHSVGAGPGGGFPTQGQFRYGPNGAGRAGSFPPTRAKGAPLSPPKGTRPAYGPPPGLNSTPG